MGQYLGLRVAHGRSIEEIKEHPLKACSSSPTQSSSHLIWLIQTLYRVSPIILNEHKARRWAPRWWS